MRRKLVAGLLQVAGLAAIAAAVGLLAGLGAAILTAGVGLVALGIAVEIG